MNLRLWIVIAGGCWLAVPGLGTAPIPHLAVPICATAPRIDGALEDACWRQAAVIDTFHAIAVSDEAARRHKAYVVRDSAWLYVAFEVDLPLDQRDPALYVGHDSTIQREDNVQVSFDPGTDGALYYQFIVNKANTRADFRMTKTKGRERETWNIPWKSGVVADPLGWKAELALPLCLLTEHGDPARARLNLIIDVFRVLRDSQHVKTGGAREFLSWSPLTSHSPANVWNEPENFGRLTGFSTDDLAAPFLPFIKAAEISRYYQTNGTPHYAVNVEMLFFSSASNAFALAITDMPTSGRSNVIEQTFQASGRTMQMRAQVPVAVETITERKVSLRLLDPTTREVWQTMAIEDVSALNMFSAFMDRDYYTTETSAVAVCQIGLPEEQLREIRFVARLGGNELARLDKPPANALCSIPINSIPLGANSVRLELVGSNDVPVSSLELAVVKRAPRPGCEWKVDRLHGRLLDNGKPFFPFGMIMTRIKPSDEYAFAEISKAGFNTMLQWSYKPDGEPVADIRAYLETAARHGLKVIAVPDMNYVPFNERTRVKDPGSLLTPDELAAVNRQLKSDTCSLGLGVKGVFLSAIKGRDAKTKTAIIGEYYENQLPNLWPVICEASQHPNLAGFLIFDEPFPNPEFGQLPVGRKFYRQIKQSDGYHPVFVNHTPHVNEFLDEWLDWSDVLGTDPYWVPESVGIRDNVGFVAWIVHHTAAKARRLRQAPWTVLQGAEYSGIKKRALNPMEQICQTYLALIHGTKGIFYFCYPERAQVNWDTLCELARRMKQLGPACVEPPVAQNVTYSPGTYDFDNRILPAIQVLLKRRPEGGFILLAASIVNRPVATVFKLGLLDRHSTVKELFSGRQFSVKDRSFTDTIEPLGVRAYHITAPEQITQPVAISVAISPQGTKPECALSFSWTGRVGMKNLLPNPSLEEVTVPGRPDYWRQTGAELKPWERIGGTNQVWGLTTNAPYHGAHCLMMTSSNRASRIVYVVQEFAHRSPERYVLSVWLRADHDQARAFLSAGKESCAVTATRDWRRYSLPFSAAAQSMLLLVRFPSEFKATLWVDAFQLEKGDTPTEFQP